MTNVIVVCRVWSTCWASLSASLCQTSCTTCHCVLGRNIKRACGQWVMEWNGDLFFGGHHFYEPAGFKTVSWMQGVSSNDTCTKFCEIHTCLGHQRNYSSFSRKKKLRNYSRVREEHLFDASGAFSSLEMHHQPHFHLPAPQGEQLNQSWITALISAAVKRKRSPCSRVVSVLV